MCCEDVRHRYALAWMMEEMVRNALRRRRVIVSERGKADITAVQLAAAIAVRLIAPMATLGKRPVILSPNPASSKFE